MSLEMFSSCSLRERRAEKPLKATAQSRFIDWEGLFSVFQTMVSQLRSGRQIFSITLWSQELLDKMALDLTALIYATSCWGLVDEAFQVARIFWCSRIITATCLHCSCIWAVQLTCFVRESLVSVNLPLWLILCPT